MSASVVIFWWGAELRLLAGGGEISALSLPAAADPIPAILACVGRPGAAGRTIRIVYHPDTLEVHEVSCPKTSRTRLRQVLTREHGLQEAADAIWGAETIRPSRQGYATLLYVDRSSRLARLAAGLRAARWRVEGAWPLPALVEAAPPCATAAGGFLAAVAQEGRALLACVGPAGDRTVRFFDGPNFADAARAEIGAMRARFEEGTAPSGLSVVEAGAGTDSFSAALAGTALTAMSLAEFLGQARRLPAGSLSDLLPRRSLLGRPSCPPQGMAFAGVALLLAALALGWTAQQDQARVQREVAAWREQHVRLTQWLAERTALARRGEQSALELSRVQAPAQPQAALLEALGRATPPEITLQAVTMAGDTFTVAGRQFAVAGSSDALARFYGRLAGPAAPWRLTDAPSAVTGGDFTLHGSFQANPAGPAPP